MRQQAQNQKHQDDQNHIHLKGLFHAAHVLEPEIKSETYYVLIKGINTIFELYKTSTV